MITSQALSTLQTNPATVLIPSGAGKDQAHYRDYLWTRPGCAATAVWPP